MLGAIKAWFSGLSLISKVATLLIGGSVAGAAVVPSSDTNSVPTEVKAISNETVGGPVIEKKQEIEKTSIAYQTKTISSSSYDEGVTFVQTEGANGIKTQTFEVTYTDGTMTSKILIKENITKEPVNKIIVKGTRAVQQDNCDPNYSPCIPYVSYDLDCPDIGVSVRVNGYDRHNFDADNDGYGCESY